MIKYVISFLLLLTASTCLTKKNKLSKPAFLVGEWIQANRLDSLKTFETWRKDFTGFGLTLKDKDTTFFEKLKIVQQKDSLFLVVTGVNEKPTYFKITQQTDTSFVAENPKNEFPKTIKYYTEYIYLKAEVSNETNSLYFVFEKREP